MGDGAEYSGVVTVVEVSTGLSGAPVIARISNPSVVQGTVWIGALGCDKVFSRGVAEGVGWLNDIAVGHKEVAIMLTFDQCRDAGEHGVLVDHADARSDEWAGAVYSEDK